MSKQKQSANHEAARRFLERRDLAVLAEEPLRFEVTDKAAGYFQIWPCIVCWSTAGLSLMFWPVSTCCPSKLMPHFSLTVSGHRQRPSRAALSWVPLHSLLALELDHRPRGLAS
jgi:hypothetical protein